MTLSLIAAVAENGVIGRDGGLPWRLSADLKRFKSLTMGHAVIMGRRTWESIGRPLPGRRMIVVSRQPGYAAAGVEVVGDFEAARTLCAGDAEAFVIGGAEFYCTALPVADRFYLTRVHAEVAGDATFPDVDWSAWRLVKSERNTADAKNEFDYSFEDYQRATQ